MVHLLDGVGGMKRGTVEFDPDKVREIIKKRGFSLIGLSRAMNMSGSWMNHVLYAGRMHEDDFKAMKEIGVDLTDAVIKPSSTTYVQKTDLGRIIRVINQRYKGLPYWAIADEEGIDPKTAYRYGETWKFNRFNVEKEDIEELLRNWEKEFK